MKPLVPHREQLPQSGIREIFDRSFGIPNVIHLEMGEPDFDTPEHIKKAGMDAIQNGFTHYTPSAGIPSLREAISRHLQQLQIDCSNDQVTITSGAVTAITLCLLALLDEGEEALVPDPGWIYPNMIISQSSVPIFYPLSIENNFLPDFNKMDKLVTDKTKVIVTNTPGNPTGAVFTEQKVKELLKFASKHDLYIISDEVYDGIIFDGKHISPMAYDTEGRVISIFSFSKNYAMTGWRLGYSVAPKHIATLISKLQEPMNACCNSISQKAAEAAINGPQQVVFDMMNTYRKRRNAVFQILEFNGVKAFNPKGAFYVMIDISNSRMSGKEFALKLLEEKKVAVAPGSAFGTNADKMVRISLATSEDQLLEGVRRICHLINNPD
jgi:aspartate aminotransferase/aminotransferase